MTPVSAAWQACDAALVISRNARSHLMKIIRPLTPLRQRMLEDMQIRHYSPHTIDGYLRYVAQFAKHFHTSPDRLVVYPYAAANSTNPKIRGRIGKIVRPGKAGQRGLEVAIPS